MKINEIFEKKNTTLSFEIFPPKRDGDIKTIYNTLDELAVLKPDYMSVTYGAAGSEKGDKTIKIASAIKNKYQIEALAHLTCVGATNKEISEILKRFKNENIENILALRGDIPIGKENEKREFGYASDLIKYIKKNNDFNVGGACYPEPHIEAKSRISDIINLKKKVDNGADFLVTQLFFDNNYYYDFMRDIRSIDIDVPVTVGIMPAINKRQIERMIKMCGITLPVKFKKIFDKYEDNPEALKDAGIAYASEQIIDLISSGVDGIHLYVMNKPEIAKRIVKNIGGILKA
jgi:methylenetetrahydrofolate reductase (NADPH)